MLKLFRDSLKSYAWILWVFIGATLILWVMMDIPGLFAPQDQTGANATAAEAGDVKVTFAEYENAYRNLESTYSQAFQGQLPEGMRETLRRQALQQALDQKLMIAEARKMGLQVSDEAVRDEILSYPVFKNEQGRFVGQETYERILRQNRIGTRKEFEEGVREQLLLQKYMGVLQASAYVTGEEVEEAFREEVERAKLKYVLLPYNRVADDIEISQEDLDAYFQEHQDEYRLPEQRRIGYLLVDTAQLRSSIELTDEELQAAYEAQQEDYRQEEQIRARHILIKTDERSAEEAEAEIQRIRERIEAGEDFAELAKELSEDPGSAANGGDLRFFPRGRMVPQFEEAAFGAQVGELVGPVATPFGAHLIEVTDRRDAGVRPFEEVQAQVRHKVLTERVAEEGEVQAQALLARINESGETSREALESIASEIESVRFLETRPFGRQDVIPGIGRSEEFASTAFDLKEDELSGLVKVPRGFAVLRLEEVLEPRVPPLADVEARVRQAVRSQRQEALAEERLAAMQASINEGTTFEDAAAALELEVKESPEVGRQGNIPELGAASNELVLQALEMEEGEIGGPKTFPQGGVLFQVAERVRMDPAEFELRKDETRDRLEAQRFQRVQASVLNQLKRDLGSTYNPQIVDSLEDSGPEALQ